jgi:abhydrolase domain-containing protein 12
MKPRKLDDDILSKADWVFLYFHGNAGNRATTHRRMFYKMITDMKCNCHVIAIDYRGFGDSSSSIPTEQGVRLDALSTFDYLLEQNVDPLKIIIVGHSLGSGILYSH